MARGACTWRLPVWKPGSAGQTAAEALFAVGRRELKRPPPAGSTAWPARVCWACRIVQRTDIDRVARVCWACKSGGAGHGQVQEMLLQGSSSTSALGVSSSTCCSISSSWRASTPLASQPSLGEQPSEEERSMGPGGHGARGPWGQGAMRPGGHEARGP